MGSPPVAPPPGAMAGQGPSPEGGAPQMNEGTSKVIRIVQMVRELAKDNPELATEVRQINDLLQKANMKMMQKSKPQEQQAPPV